MPEISPKQALFAVAYARGKNLKDAAVAAGYREANADSQASKLIRMPHVAEAVARERERVDTAVLARSVYTIEGQLEKLENIYRLAMADENYSAATKVVEAQNKMLGLNAAERVEHEHSGEITHKVEREQSERDRADNLLFMVDKAPGEKAPLVIQH